MTRKLNRWPMMAAVLLLTSLACTCGLLGGQLTQDEPPAASGGGGGGTGPEPTQVPASATEAPAAGGAGGTGGYQTEFPLPDDVQNFIDFGEGAINFQTGMSIDDAIDFYRREFADQGLTERAINTAITDTTFSMVFDGHASGQAVVIQGVDLGGSTNINIRFEDV